jgi:hypothetical protein
MMQSARRTASKWRRAEVVARLLIEHKPEVIAALAPASTLPATIDLDDGSDPAWWRRQFTIRTIHWGPSGKRIKVEAEGLAYGELLDEWRKSQGRRCRFGSAPAAMNRSAACRRCRSPTKTASTSVRSANV